MTLKQKLQHRLRPSLNSGLTNDLELRFGIPRGALQTFAFYGNSLDDAPISELAAALGIRENAR